MIVATPLAALDAVVVDTETTGLDATRARILQIGAVRIAGAALVGEPFESKVNPGVAIPPETTRIHGLDAAALAGAPEFRTAYSAFRAFAGENVLIGHNIGFDLAVLDAECKLAGLPRLTNAVLDSRLLAEICLPRFGGYTLDKLAAHLGLTIEGRHDALADARITARVFLGLVPLLRQHGIRTLPEAETACRRLTAVLDEYGRVGWREPIRSEVAQPSALERIDAFPFRHRVRDVASMPPAWTGPETPLGTVIADMARLRISSLFVSASADALVEPLGIVTERDVIRLVGERGAACLNEPAGPLATRPLESVPADAFVYRAIGRMEQKHIRHLGVVDEAGAIIGALSARDLLRLRSSDALALGDAIDHARSIADLAASWSRLPRVAARLLAEQISAREIAAVISREIGALTRRASREAEAELVASGAGPAPAPYAVLLMGSGGRGESLLIPDQDNAVIHAEAHDASAAADWFGRHGKRMNAILDEIGIPLCKGNVMAGNAAWNGDPAAWHARLADWTGAIAPADLLAVDIFFDFRFVDGDARLASDLRSHSLAVARGSRPLIKLLADQLRSWSPPLGFLGRITAVDGRVDLKKGGLFPVVAAARCLALSHGIVARSTVERLAKLGELGIGSAEDLAMLDSCHARFSDLILRQQIRDIGRGLPPTTLVELAGLSRPELAELKASLAALRIVPDMTHDLLFAGTSPG